MNQSRPEYRLSAAAEADISAIFRKSMEDFGEDAARRYTRLLSLAFQEIAQRPALEGSRELEHGIHLYHLRHSSKRAGIDGVTVRRPRHFVAYRKPSDRAIEIIRILHDAMDIDAHLTRVE